MGAAAGVLQLRFSLGRPRIDLVFQISQGRKTCSLLGAVRPATAKRVESVAVKRVHLSCAA